ncbi:MAG TPA: AGE family epimerase/isomerase [Burkholderiaceae bacterium]|nr:AGE family epimerase/isomerase [Burkholderiaceae bacterium]
MTSRMNAADFQDADFIAAHVERTLAFYYPRAIDPIGGHYQFLLDDGTVYDPHTRHLVSSTRYVFVWANAWRRFGLLHYRRELERALDFLRRAHRDPQGGGYAWLLSWRAGRVDQVLDPANHCYGLAFVLLAYAHGLRAGVADCRAWLQETWDLMERRFWEPARDLYADEADATWNVSPYRGQNANMHSCEALIAAFEATGDERFLDRATTVARSITERQAALAGGLIWEHYREDWSVDWDYNRNDRTNIFRPWGFQPGHLTEWAKLLVLLDRHRQQPGRTERAAFLFDIALDTAWDAQHGGIAYGFAPDRSICDGDKYHWVQAESLAAAALLGEATGDAKYWNWYTRLWEYCWRHFVDHQHGAWFRILGPDNRKITNEKSPAGKVDYHDMGACYDIIDVLRRRAGTLRK